VHTYTTHPEKPAKDTVGVRGKVQISGWMFKPEADGKSMRGGRKERKNMKKERVRKKGRKNKKDRIVANDEW
jgi:hypothetical protein